MHELQHYQLGCLKNNQGGGQNDADPLFDFALKLRNTLRLLIKYKYYIAVARLVLLKIVIFTAP
jgi:hypothetical protein